jgi:hypothetical protein
MTSGTCTTHAKADVGVDLTCQKIVGRVRHVQLTLQEMLGHVEARGRYCWRVTERGKTLSARGSL